MAKRMFIAAFTVDDADWSPDGPPDQHDIVNWLSMALNGEAENLVVWKSESDMHADGPIILDVLLGEGLPA